MFLYDTILATSSPAGAGLRAIVRLSGPDAWVLVRAITDLPSDAAPGCRPSRSLTCLPTPNGFTTIHLFRSPRSFTGQDIAELHIPGSPALIGLVIDQLLAAGRSASCAVRLAEPGEFSARAFLAGKIDLTQAEGIAATIAATSGTQLRAAASLRRGDLHRAIDRLTQSLADLLALVEAGIDFTDEEDIHLIDPVRLSTSLNELARDVEQRLASSIHIDQLAAPPTVVFIGRPNVGKSSLINALAGLERSIVSSIAGTTRDTLSVAMTTPHGTIRLIDVPGEEPATDELRAKMMATRENALLDADLIIQVMTDFEGPAASVATYGTRCLTLRNKSDLLPREVRAGATPAWQFVSALSGEHIAELRQVITDTVLRRAAAGTQRSVLNHRHRAILHETHVILLEAAALAESGAGHPELLASELRRALDLLGQITGAISPDELLGRIFSQFCIGK